MPDVTKLPKWAQQRLLEQERELIRNAEYIKGLEEELAANAPEATVHYSTGFRGPDRPIPEGSAVHFRVKDEQGRPSVIRVRLDDDRYTKRAYLDINADRGLNIEPRSGNSIYITPKD